MKSKLRLFVSERKSRYTNIIEAGFAKDLEDYQDVIEFKIGDPKVNLKVREVEIKHGQFLHFHKHVNK